MVIFLTHVSSHPVCTPALHKSNVDRQLSLTCLVSPAYQSDVEETSASHFIVKVGQVSQTAFNDARQIFVHLTTNVWGIFRLSSASRNIIASVDIAFSPAKMPYVQLQPCTAYICALELKPLLHVIEALHSSITPAVV